MRIFWQSLCTPVTLPVLTDPRAAKWMVAPGDKITPGDHLCDIETDKATIGWEAQEEGYVAKIFVEDGASDIAVGTVSAHLCSAMTSGGIAYGVRARLCCPNCSACARELTLTGLSLS